MREPCAMLRTPWASSTVRTFFRTRMSRIAIAMAPPTIAVPSGRLVKDAFDMTELPNDAWRSLFGGFFNETVLADRRERSVENDCGGDETLRRSPAARGHAPFRKSPLRFQAAAMDSMAT